MFTKAILNKTFFEYPMEYEFILYKEVLVRIFQNKLPDAALISFLTGLDL